MTMPDPSKTTDDRLFSPCSPHPGEANQANQANQANGIKSFINDLWNGEKILS